ncbi:MAG: phage tail sheath family protein [Chloroflexales bacterium]|nr:phage tail sheath family protein [Chloroflexales bacterium]
MPVEYKVPGVYIEELPAGSRPIQGVGTAMPAFIGFTFTRPPGNTGQPVLIASWSQFVDAFCTRPIVKQDGTPGEEVRIYVGGFYLPYAVYGYFLNGGQACYVQSLATIEDQASVDSGAVSLTTLPLNGSKKALQLRSKGGLKQAKQLTVKIERSAGGKAGGAAQKAEGGEPKGEGAEPKVEGPEPKAEAGGGGEGLFKLSIYLGDPARDKPEESFDGLTLGKATRGARNLVEVLERESRLLSAIAPALDPAEALALCPPDALYKPDQFFHTSRIVEPDAITGDVTERTGLGALEEISDITMLVCPDLMSAYMRTEKQEDDRLILAGLQKDLLNHCTTMKDRFAILDAPPAMSVAEIQTYRMSTANFDSDTGKYGAIYYPWICVANPEAKNGGERMIMIPPSGHIAGIYARVDEERGVHKAPANEAIRGALKLERRLIDPEQGVLNPIGVNCIREFPGRGILVWGARTLAAPSSEWRYINVRRLFNFIEESIYEGTQWVVFEPNDMDTWERVKRTITAFLNRVWSSGALFGATADEAFYVKCDAELNTPAVRDAGQLIVEVGLAPVKPAEFVIFRFKQMSGGGGVSE